MWVGDGLAIHGRNHIAALDSRGGGRRILLRLRDKRAGGVFQSEIIRDVSGDGLNFNPDPAAGHNAILLELLHDGLDDVARNGEANADAAAGRRKDRCVDADHLALGVEGRAAGIAVVNRRVDLQEVVVGSGADVAPARRDDAGRHRAAKTERVADRDHPIADPRRCARRKSTKGKSAPCALKSARSVLLSTPITLAGIDLPSAVVMVTSVAWSTTWSLVTM